MAWTTRFNALPGELCPFRLRIACKSWIMPILRIERGRRSLTNKPYKLGGKTKTARSTFSFNERVFQNECQENHTSRRICGEAAGKDSGASHLRDGWRRQKTVPQNGRVPKTDRTDAKQSPGRPRRDQVVLSPKESCIFRLRFFRGESEAIEKGP